MSRSGLVSASIQGRVLTLTMARQPVNAMSRALMADLAEGLEEAAINTTQHTPRGILPRRR